MHGLVFFAFQSFVRDTCSVACWDWIVERAALPVAGFEPMLSYDAVQLAPIVCAAEKRLGKGRAEMLEDVGTYLVSHPSTSAIRRLLRFGGADFREFLESMNDLPDRARLAIPDLTLPRLELVDLDADLFRLTCDYPEPLFGPVMVGLIRTMADDYGALATTEYRGRSGTIDIIDVTVLSDAFGPGRRFDLAREVAPA